MRILGIDPGLKATGYGFIDLENNKPKLIEIGTIKPKQKDLIQNKINKVYSILAELISKYKPDILVLEKLYAHYKHPITASILGHIRGVICLLCAQKNVELVEHSAKRIRKAIIGNGNASKMQIKKVISHTFSIDENKLTLDASDAVALALGYIYINSSKIKYDCKNFRKTC